ncbi:four-carbon acid sugar kinase family protein [soil metagenome]
MPQRWLILADDLTGAADCAIPFARRGARVSVHWNAATVDQAADVVSFDAATRGLSAGEAAERHRGLLDVLPWRGRRVFKKIDSTLRGQPAAEIAAVLAATGLRSALCAPAFPAQGRVTRGGRVFVNGVPLEATTLWAQDRTYASGDLAAMLATDGVVAVIRDAETDADLDRIVAADLAGPDCLSIGSAGLATALARAIRDDKPQACAIEPRPGNVLVVAGSRAEATRAAVSRLAASAGVRYLRLSEAAAGEALAAALAVGDVVLDIGGDGAEPADAELADRLGRLAASAAAAVGGIVATGGETAAAVLRHLGVEGIRLFDEVEAGVPLGLTLGRVAVPIVTKAGAFGDGETLLRALQRLRAIRQKGRIP